MNSLGLKISLMVARVANREQSKIESGRTDAVFDLLAQGGQPTAGLLGWCAYYGDVSAMRHLHPLPGTGEVSLHAALCPLDRLRRNLVMKVLLVHGANPNVTTKPGVETVGLEGDPL